VKLVDVVVGCIHFSTSPFFNSRCGSPRFMAMVQLILNSQSCQPRKLVSRGGVESEMWRTETLRNQITSLVHYSFIQVFFWFHFLVLLFISHDETGAAASRGGEDSSRATAELTKANSSEYHVGLSQTPSTPAPTGANLHTSAAGYYSSYCGITGSAGSSVLAPATSTGGAGAPGSAGYRDHGDQSSGEWDVRRWNEERERDRETWINDPEWLRVESWLDEHPNFCLDYFLRLVAVNLFSPTTPLIFWAFGVD
jgi:hypothetical protein